MGDTIIHLNENILALDKEVRAFDALKKGMDADEATKRIQAIYDRYVDEIAKTQAEFYGIINKLIPANVRKTTKFLYNSKPVESIVSKVFTRGKQFSKLGDLVRGALLFQDQADLDNFVKDFERKNGSLIKAVERKEKGGDKTYGYYGSIHYDLEINGFIVELQVMTTKLWNYKHSAHEIYTANREKAVPRKADLALSKKIFALGNKPRRLREHADFDLDYAESLSKRVWLEVPLLEDFDEDQTHDMIDEGLRAAPKKTKKQIMDVVTKVFVSSKKRYATQFGVVYDIGVNDSETRNAFLRLNTLDRTLQLTRTDKSGTTVAESYELLTRPVSQAVEEYLKKEFWNHS